MKIRFTDSWVERLRYKPSGAVQQIYWDTTQEGLGARISPAGTVAWIVQHKGKRGTLGRYPEVKLEDARKRAWQVRNDMHPAEELINDPTIGQAVIMYVASRVNAEVMRIETSKDYQDVIVRYMGDKLDIKLRHVTTEDVKTWYAEICERTVSKANYCFRILRAVCTFFVESRPWWNWSNPVQILTTLKLWRKVKKSRAIVHKDSLPAWFAAMDRAPLRLRTAMMLALFAGLRKENASGLRIEWVDTDARIIRIPDEKMKGKVAFDLPIGPALADLLAAAKPAADSGWFFPATRDDDEGHYREFYGAVRTAAERAGVKFTPHAVRRTFATVAYGLGTQLITIGRLLSHSLEHAPRNEEVTGGYVNDSCETLRTHVEAVERAILAYAGRADLIACPVGAQPAPALAPPSVHQAALPTTWRELDIDDEGALTI